ncbi:probable methyltransferase PMT16 [Lycium barbarum]|uniref:probable methyltransferase PMT16 n=1 Tax=Lycium barbarum TaxID=112863 RepID=UPI00293E1AF7|nr:probable methyltransferase PMT16 [Lycium barbarum]
MAGPKTPPYYSPTYKRNGPNFASSPHTIRINLYTLAIAITVLCSVAYLFGRGSISTSPVSNVPATIPCIPLKITSTTAVSNNSLASTSTQVDFSASQGDDEGEGTGPDDGAKVYPPCDIKYSEYTPCEDPQRSLKFKRDRLIYRERHCPDKSQLLKCRIPAPHGYKKPFKWPKSRDLAWYANVPHKELTVEKAVQNWIRKEGDKFRFPGGGTMFPNGADAYVDDIDKLINLKDGSIRTAIDTGCGVASWGAYLLSRDILAMSFAPRDTHEAQVQFALERGVPALIGVLASKRLPYPSRAFDMAHCSRCLIPWDQEGGAYLMEVDRVLRPGGYWILSGPPIRWRKYFKGWERTREDLNGEQTRIEEVAKKLCWKKFVEKDDIAIWQKPYNHFQCKEQKKKLMCPAQDPDRAWYTELETCVTPLPEVSSEEDVAGGQLEKWPKRLHAIPPRISSGAVNGVTAESFKKDSQLWQKRVSYYKSVDNKLNQPGRYRNLLDMNAYLGGFAASWVDDPVWVMNIVPAEAEVNTLGVIYERGLVGTYQSWCEAMSTYPRTYDLLHADSVFTMYKDKCEMEDILLEMDRILRPEGSVIIREDVDILVEVKKIADGLNWETLIVDHEDGPMEREKLLFAVKSYWTAPATQDSKNNTSASPRI